MTIPVNGSTVLEPVLTPALRATLVDLAWYANEEGFAQKDLDEALLAIRKELADEMGWTMERLAASAGMGARNLYARQPRFMNVIRDLACRQQKRNGRHPIAIMMEASKFLPRRESDFAEILDQPEVRCLVSEAVKEGYLSLVSGTGLKALYKATEKDFVYSEAKTTASRSDRSKRSLWVLENSKPTQCIELRASLTAEGQHHLSQFLQPRRTDTPDFACIRAREKDTAHRGTNGSGFGITIHLAPGEPADGQSTWSFMLHTTHSAVMDDSYELSTSRGKLDAKAVAEFTQRDMKRIIRPFFEAEIKRAEDLGTGTRRDYTISIAFGPSTDAPSATSDDCGTETLAVNSPCTTKGGGIVGRVSTKLVLLLSIGLLPLFHANVAIGQAERSAPLAISKQVNHTVMGEVDSNEAEKGLMETFVLTRAEKGSAEFAKQLLAEKGSMETIVLTRAEKGSADFAKQLEVLIETIALTRAEKGSADFAKQLEVLMETIVLTRAEKGSADFAKQLEVLIETIALTGAEKGSAGLAKQPWYENGFVKPAESMLDTEGPNKLVQFVTAESGFTGKVVASWLQAGPNRQFENAIVVSNYSAQEFSKGGTK